MSYVQAKTGFVIFDKKTRTAQRVKQGRFFEENDPVVQSNPSQFVSVDDMAARMTPIERATAEPGERRSVGRPKVEQPKDEQKVVDEPKGDSKPASGRRSPVKMDTVDLPKGKQDGEV